MHRRGRPPRAPPPSHARPNPRHTQAWRTERRDDTRPSTAALREPRARHTRPRTRRARRVRILGARARRVYRARGARHLMRPGADRGARPTLHWRRTHPPTPEAMARRRGLPAVHTHGAQRQPILRPENGRRPSVAWTRAHPRAPLRRRRCRARRAAEVDLRHDTQAGGRQVPPIPLRRRIAKGDVVLVRRAGPDAQANRGGRRAVPALRQSQDAERSRTAAAAIHHPTRARGRHRHADAPR